MKITKNNLKKIIQEELVQILEYVEDIPPWEQRSGGPKLSAIEGTSEGEPPEDVNIGSRQQNASGIWEWAEGYGITNGMPDENKPGWALVNPATMEIY